MTDKTTLGPPPKDGSLFRAVVGMLAILTGVTAFVLLFFVEIPPRNENALMLALGIVIGWGSAVVQSEYGASTTGRKAAESALKQFEKDSK
jgi:hypothetical protein